MCRSLTGIGVETASHAIEPNKGFLSHSRKMQTPFVAALLAGSHSEFDSSSEFGSPSEFDPDRLIAAFSPTNLSLPSKAGIYATEQS